MDLPAVNGQTGSPAANRQYWLSNEGLTSEAYFRERLFALVNDSWSAYNAGDVERMERNLESIAWVEPLVQHEPFLSFYETGLVHAGLAIACRAVAVFDIEQGYAVAERCRNVLIGKRNRRREQGLTYRPDSECWFRLYNVLATLKWKGSESQRNTVITPENLVCDYLKIERRCIEFLEGGIMSGGLQQKQIMHGLGWCGVQVIKMASRWCPQHVPVLIDDFNQTHGKLLTARPGHFLESKPTDPMNPWYWDFELFKWCMFGPATKDEATLCHQWRLDSSKSAYTDFGDIKGYHATASRELEFLLHSGVQPRVGAPVC